MVQQYQTEDRQELTPPKPRRTHGYTFSPEHRTTGLTYFQVFVCFFNTDIRDATSKDGKLVLSTSITDEIDVHYKSKLVVWKNTNKEIWVVSIGDKDLRFRLSKLILKFVKRGRYNLGQFKYKKYSSVTHYA